MSRRPQVVAYLTGLAIVLLTLGLVAIHGTELLYEYGWVVFPGIFVVAIVARVIESAQRRRRLAKFRQRR